MSGVGPEYVLRMTVESHHQRSLACLPGLGTKRGNDELMSEVNTIEHSYSGHRAVQWQSGGVSEQRHRYFLMMRIVSLHNLMNTSRFLSIVDVLIWRSPPMKMKPVSLLSRARMVETTPLSGSGSGFTM